MQYRSLPPARPIALEFVPNALPEPANSGHVTFTFGRYDDGGWGVVRADEHYAGEVMGISGTVDRTTTVLHARHYATIEEARRAMQAG